MHLIHELVKEAAPVIRDLAAPCEYEEKEGEPTPLSDEHLMQWVGVLIRSTRWNTSSMLQDVKNGKRTEIDYINGYIVAEAERLGHECEKHAMLVEMVKKGEVIAPGDITSRLGLKMTKQGGFLWDILTSPINWAIAAWNLFR